MPVRARPRQEHIEVDEEGNKIEKQNENGEDGETGGDKEEERKIVCQLSDTEGNAIAGNIMIPVNSSPAQLQQLLKSVLLSQREEKQKRRERRKNNQDEDDEDEEPSDSDDDEATWNVPHGFFLDDGRQVLYSVMESLHQIQKEQWLDKQLKQGRRVRQGEGEKLPFVAPSEQLINITARPEAVFRVRPVTRCAASLEGHSDAVLVVAFSPDGECLASGGGDRQIRIWDIATTTPIEVLEGHNHWVQVISWSPDSRFFASGSRDGGLRCWKHNGNYNEFKSTSLQGHSNWLSHISWEPLHKCKTSNTDETNITQRFVSASKDQNLRVWSVGSNLPELSLQGGHTACVTCVKWGGQDLIYSSSQDRSVIVWSAFDGSQIAKWTGHAHWVNFLALNTDLVLRTGSFDHESRKFETQHAARDYAKKRYDTVIDKNKGERIISCSDDNTMFLWGVTSNSLSSSSSSSSPSSSSSSSSSASSNNKPIARLTGHQGLIYHAAFSPDGTLLASCSNDKSVRLWHADTGKFMHCFRGHVAPVYHVSWSLDSRMLVSGSRDTTLKQWSVAKKELVEDMVGHADEIFSTDWSPGGTHVATGSKDKTVRIWVH